ncbi:macrophage erythroblast attacher-like isoform X2 [Durio zibethinus]|uniref:Macrophage erythroblast attacher-like isoform X2 n=1 Tax=Durio zibethinus TaxID=66656 RepID=A0A6P6AKB5_DURZI|nr:macrophage erythroblast attacher-like isoform X2 [Durio zibethinus]
MDIFPLPNGAGSTAPITPETAGTTTTIIVASNTTPSSKLSQLTESLKLEHQFLRVPFEHFKKTIRANHRTVEKEVSAVISSVADVADSNELSKDDAVLSLTSLVSRLQGLKRKLEEGSQTENLQAQRCRARLDHLESVDVENLCEWNNVRLKRILLDYLLRMSYYDTAMKLAESSNILDLVDIDVFKEAKKVIDALRSQEVGPALAWCVDNKSRLKKSKSKFEFQLRLQEFVELVRAENYMRAILYARRYLSPWGATHLKELQRVMATLAVRSNTECAKYKVLFEPKQWDFLVDQFKQEFCRYCYEDDCTKEDPLSQDSFRKLALPLPYSKQHHSKLVCYITKELMDTENPPQVLPNGYVYSTKALKEMAEKNNGKITCPRTGLVCNYSELVKAYIS